MNEERNHRTKNSTDDRGNEDEGVHLRRRESQQGERKKEYHHDRGQRLDRIPEMKSLYPLCLGRQRDLFPFSSHRSPFHAPASEGYSYAQNGRYARLIGPVFTTLKSYRGR